MTSYLMTYLRHQAAMVSIVLWSFAFGMTSFAIVMGNTFTIAAFVTNKKLVRMRACYFLVSLAVADMMIGVITVPMYIIFLNYHLTNRDYQTVYTAVDIASGFASVFTLTAIALERLYAFLFPLRYRITQTTRTYVGLVMILWVMSAVITTMHMLYRYQVLQFHHFFYTMFSCLTICLVIMCASYVGIWIKVHYHYRQNHRNPERNFARTIFIVTTLFIFTWLPFHLLNIVNYFCDSCIKQHMPINFLFFCKLLQYANSFINPIIYTFQMPEFKITLIKMLCKLQPIRADESRRVEEVPLDKIEDYHGNKH